MKTTFIGGKVAKSSNSRRFKLKFKRELVSWVFQILALLILMPAAWNKFVGENINVFIFSQLDMEPTGRILIGLFEITACILLLTRSFCHLGAIIAFGTMLGAIIAHSTFLGWEIKGDRGLTLMMLFVVLFSSTIVMYLKRRSLPFVGKSFD